MEEPVTVSRESYERCLVGGDHLAAALVAYECVPEEQLNHEQVLAEYGCLCADMWVAWRAIAGLRWQDGR